MNFLSRLSFLLLTVGLFATSAAAQSDRCYIVVASEMDGYDLQQNPAYPDHQTHWVIVLHNGRFAATIGSVSRREAPSVLTALKQAGRIAQDSFCMSPDRMSMMTNLGGAPTNGGVLPLNRDEYALDAPSPEESLKRDIEKLENVDTVLNAQSDVEIKGLSWKMTPREMIAAVQERGMNCKILTLSDIYAVCKGNDAGEIMIEPEFRRFTIDCHLINACKVEIENAAPAILESLSISQFGFEMRNTLFGMKAAYCGTSEGGNRVCVEPGNSIRVEAGQAGGVNAINLQ